MSQLILSTKDIISNLERLLEDNIYKLSKAKSPVVKRSVKNTIEFFSSVVHHLKEYEKIRIDLPKTIKIIS